MLADENLRVECAGDRTSIQRCRHVSRIALGWSQVHPSLRDDHLHVVGLASHRELCTDRDHALVARLDDEWTRAIFGDDEERFAALQVDMSLGLAQGDPNTRVRVEYHLRAIAQRNRFESANRSR